MSQRQPARSVSKATSVTSARGTPVSSASHLNHDANSHQARSIEHSHAAPRKAAETVVDCPKVGNFWLETLQVFQPPKWFGFGEGFSIPSGQKPGRQSHYTNQQRKPTMSLRLGALQDALLDPGNADKARLAAEEVAGYDKDLGRLRIEVRAHSVLLGVVVASVFYLLNVVMQMYQTLAAMQQTLNSIAAKIGVP